MTGLNLSIPQGAITDYVKEHFPNYVVYENDVLDDDFILKIDGKAKPYIVLRYGGIIAAPTGGSFMGARYDEYFSTVDVNVVAPTPKQSSLACNIVIDRLLGWKPTGGSALTISGGSANFAVRNANGVPHAYLSSVRMDYAINSEDPGAYITP